MKKESIFAGLPDSSKETRVHIGGGRQGSKRLATPAGEGVRPTTARAREALFSMLGERVAGAWVLDLYAGSGALGLEALRRGAERVWFVENNPEHSALLRRNLQACGQAERGRVVTGSANAAALYTRLGTEIQPLAGRRDAFSLLLMDPPYGQGLVGATLDLCGRSGILAAGAWAVADHEPGCPDAVTGRASWQWRQSRRYGASVLTFWCWSPPTKPVAKHGEHE